MKAIRLFLGLFFSVSLTFCFSQQSHQESLRHFNESYDSLRLNDLDAVPMYLDSMYRLYTHGGFEKGQAEVLYKMAELDLQKAQFPSAYDSFMEAQVIYTRIKDDAGLAKTYSGLGTVEGRRGNLLIANELLINALAIYEEIGDDRGRGTTYLRLGVVKERVGDYDSAIESYNKALTFALRTDTNNVITLYNNIGAAHIYKEELDQAIPFFKRALDFAQGPEYESSQALALSNLAVCFKMKGDIKSSREYFSRGVQLAEKHQLKEEKLIFRNNLISLYQEEEPQRAIKDLESVWKEADSLQIYHIAASSASRIIKLHKELGNHTNVIEWMEEANRLSSIIFDEAKNREIRNLQAVHELKKSREDISGLEEKIRLREKADLYFWLVFATLAIGLLVAVWMNIRYQRINAILKIREK